VFSKARIAVVGLGALGSVCAEILTRSGIGYLRLIDRDRVELHNLARCTLYTESDALSAKPKALAAVEHLEAVNSTIDLEPCFCNLDSSNALELLAGVDLILDGSDNFELRTAVNEAAQRLATPWIYTGVLATIGMIMPVMPEGPCFRCLSPTPPAPGNYPTCVTEGVLAATTRIAATLEVTLALKLLLHGAGLLSREEVLGAETPLGLPRATMLHFDIWEPELERIEIVKDPHCPVCGV